ncbi:MAG: hypothetical protein ABI887_14640 [Burkholderiales bacterium]
MPGTLLVYDADFPRAATARGERIINRPTAAELMDNHYPAPQRLLAIPSSLAPDAYVALILREMRTFTRAIDVLAIFGHGVVSSAATPGGSVAVTTGILLGASPITQSSASLLSTLRGHLARHARCELWVCQAASRGGAGGLSGHNLCQAIADALRVEVRASAIDQQTDTIGGAGTLESEIQFLPWDGEVETIRPSGRRG